MCNNDDAKDEAGKKTIVLPESLDLDLEKIRNKVGAKSDSELIHRAYALYKKLINPNVGKKATS